MTTKEKRIFKEVEEIFSQEGRITSQDIKNAFILFDNWLIYLRNRFKTKEVNQNLEQYWAHNKIVLRGFNIPRKEHQSALKKRPTRKLFIRLTRFYQIKSLPRFFPHQQKFITYFNEQLWSRHKNKIFRMLIGFHKNKIEQDLKDDLEQQAVLGIMRAFDYYNPKAPGTYVNYADPWIRQKFLEHVKGDKQIHGLSYKSKVTIDHKMANGTDRVFQDSVIDYSLSEEERGKMESSLKFLSPFECEHLKIQ